MINLTAHNSLDVDAGPLRITSKPSLAKTAAAIWIGLLVTASIIYGVTGWFDANSSSSAILQPPLIAGVLGTDHLGRDVLARVVAGSWTSLSIGMVSVCAAMIFGSLLGMIAAIRPKVIGEIIARLTDILLAFPAIILALLLGYMLGTGYVSVVLVIAIVLMPQFVRLVRTRVMVELDSGYVLAERAVGASQTYILGYHVLRNVLAPVLNFAVLEVSDAILFEAALSFLSVGIQPPTASWGNMLLDAQSTLFAGAWWMSVFPGLALFATILSVMTLVEDSSVSSRAFRFARRQ
jgi:peptide/nickel transport system permease protein